MFQFVDLLLQGDDLVLQRSYVSRVASLLANAGKPDYSIDGQSVSWGAMWDRLAKMDAALALAEGPIELATEMDT